MISLIPYGPNDAEIWNAVVRQSKNGSFLHLRNYLDYHSDRFIDRSAVILRSGRAVAVFPASLHGDEIRSHGGVTYGGLIYNESLSAVEVIEAFDRIKAYYAGLGVVRILYKAVPSIFHRYPSDEDLYALFRVGARLVRRDLSSAIFLTADFRYSKGRKWSVNKARKAGVVIRKGASFGPFHGLLSEVVSKFGAQPTHSLDELVLLQSRFPDNIVLFEAMLEDQLAAGAVIYDFGATVHTQYLAASHAGREIGALDFLLVELIEKQYASRKYFSFGISTEQEGKFLNTGLVAQKEGFGARGIVHDFYDWVL